MQWGHSESEGKKEREQVLRHYTECPSLSTGALIVVLDDDGLSLALFRTTGRLVSSLDLTRHGDAWMSWRAKYRLGLFYVESIKQTLIHD